VVIPEIVTEGASMPPPPIQPPSESHLPRTSDTQRSPAPPEPTVVDKPISRSTIGLTKPRRSEKQVWLVAGGVIGAGLLGGLVLWLINLVQAGPAAWADWNEEVKTELIDAYVAGGVNSPHGRRLYSEVMTVLENDASGNWLLGRGITKDGVAQFIRFRGSSYDVRAVSADEARRNNLADDEIQSTYDKSLENREEQLAAVSPQELRLVTEADGKTRLRGRVGSRLTGKQVAEDMTLEIRIINEARIRSVEPVAVQAVTWQELAAGSVAIDAACTRSAPMAGDELDVSLYGFLYQPKPGIYRLSRGTTCRLTQ
jgi:hypothetical protein